MLSLQEVEDAAQVVYAAMPPTAQCAWPLLARRTGCDVWVKHENHTPIGAFKVRGGLVYMERLKHTQPRLKGVISATRGNHGQSIAVGAAKVSLATLMLAGHAVPKLVRPASTGLALFMLGAIGMHVKVKDPIKRSMPAITVLTLSTVAALTAERD